MKNIKITKEEIKELFNEMENIENMMCIHELDDHLQKLIKYTHDSSIKHWDFESYYVQNLLYRIPGITQTNDNTKTILNPLYIGMYKLSHGDEIAGVHQAAEKIKNEEEAKKMVRENLLKIGKYVHDISVTVERKVGASEEEEEKLDLNDEKFEDTIIEKSYWDGLVIELKNYEVFNKYIKIIKIKAENIKKTVDNETRRDQILELRTYFNKFYNVVEPAVAYEYRSCCQMHTNNKEIIEGVTMLINEILEIGAKIAMHDNTKDITDLILDKVKKSIKWFGELSIEGDRH